MPLFLFTIDPAQLENNFLFRFLAHTHNRLHTALTKGANSIHTTANTYLNLIAVKKNNRRLLRENQELKARLMLLEEAQHENQRLKKIIKFKKNKAFDLLIAQVVSRDPVSNYQMISINKGEKDGVKKRMMVINEQGFVGYVFRSEARSSQVILLTDPRASILATVKRSRVHGILEGANGGLSQLKFLKRKDDVKAGDVILTEEKGFPIGRTAKVSKEEYGLTQEVIVTPFIKPSQLEEVLVVK